MGKPHYGVESFNSIIPQFHDFAINEKRLSMNQFKVSGFLCAALAVAVATTAVGQEVENETEALGKVRAEDREGTQFVIEGDDWIPLKYIKTPASGGVLDFSTQPYLHRPAGKFGRVVAKNGHFEFENLPGVPQRFYGVNLCNDANFPDHKTAVELAERLSRMGYNCVRFHHHDRMLARGKGPELDADAVERLDYFVAELIKRGIYIESDIHVGRGRMLDWKDLGVEEPSKPWRMLYEVKTLFTLHPPAFSNWCAFARSWLTHRNPYTGRTYAEEPCWTGMSLINEGRYVFPFEQTRELAPFKKAWRDWISARRAEDPSCYPGIPVSDRYPEVKYADMQNCTLPQVCCDFAADMQRGFLNRARSFLVGKLGFKAPLSNENNAPDNVAISLARSDSFDYVEVHSYGGGQGRVEKPSKICRVMNRNVFLPAHDNVTDCSWRRLVDKPFSITETSYGQPNPHRAGGYAKLGALAAFQDWGSIFHFAYAHGLKNFPEGEFGGGTRFDIQQDPVKALADKIPFLLFLRRDLKPAPEGVALVLDEEALHPKSGVGAGSVPAWGTNFMWRCRVGSVAPGHPARGMRTIPHQKGFDKVEPPFSLAPCEELTLDEELGVLKVDTPRTVVGVLSGGRFDTPRVRCILGNNMATVVATAVDGKTLERSGRILFMVLGDVQRLGEVYANESRTVMLKRGSNGKTVVRRMKVPVMLRLENPSAYEVYAVDTSGARLGKVKTEVKGNRLMFMANTEFAPGTGVVAWEIVK